MEIHGRDTIPAAEARGYAIVRGRDDATRDQDWYEEWSGHCSIKGKACLTIFLDGDGVTADITLDTLVTGWRFSEAGQAALLETASTWLNQPWVTDLGRWQLSSDYHGARLDYELVGVPAFCAEGLARGWVGVLARPSALEPDPDLSVVGVG